MLIPDGSCNSSFRLSTFPDFKNSDSMGKVRYSFNARFRTIDDARRFKRQIN